MAERRWLHPHDPTYVVIDTMGDDGKWTGASRLEAATAADVAAVFPGLPPAAWTGPTWMGRCSVT
jgi:hypothetical protein